MKATLYAIKALTLAGIAAIILPSCSPTPEQYGDSFFGFPAPGPSPTVPVSGNKPAPGSDALLGKTSSSTPQGKTAPEPVSPERNYPLATKTENPNQVISPYPPHNIIQIAGFKNGTKDFKSGELARDKSTGKIFVIP